MYTCLERSAGKKKSSPRPTFTLADVKSQCQCPTAPDVSQQPPSWAPPSRKHGAWPAPLSPTGTCSPVSWETPAFPPGSQGRRLLWVCWSLDTPSQPSPARPQLLVPRLPLPPSEVGTRSWSSRWEAGAGVSHGQAQGTLAEPRTSATP